MCNYFMTLELFVTENIMWNLTSAVTRSKRHHCVILQNQFPLFTDSTEDEITREIKKCDEAKDKEGMCVIILCDM